MRITNRMALISWEYNPKEEKPEWVDLMIRTGRAYEFGETPKMKAHISFGDKRSQHKAYIGDKIILDELGRVDVHSASKASVRSSELDLDRDTASVFKTRMDKALSDYIHHLKTYE